MNERIRKDYQNLKEFIENISHEIQNPLAIIKSRIDLLLQSESPKNLSYSHTDKYLRTLFMVLLYLTLIHGIKVAYR